MKKLALLIFLLLMMSAYAATPNPGHDASRIGPGTFPAGDFTFNGSIAIQNTSNNPLFYFNSTNGALVIGTGTLNGGQLQVYTTNTTGSIRIGGGNGAGNSRVFIQSNGDNSYIDSFGNNAHQKLTIEASQLLFNANGGPVGINDTTPSHALDVSGAIQAQASIITPQVCLNGDCRTSWPAGSSGGNITGSGTGNYVARWNNGTHLATGLIYDNTTHVGIGTTSPAAKLSVAGGDILVDSTHGFWINSYTSAFAANYINLYGAGQITSTIDGNLSFSHNSGSTTNMIIKNNGNVGIGTASPQYRLSLGASNDQIGFYSDSTHYSNIKFYDGSTGGMYFDHMTAAGGGYHFLTGGGERMVIEYGGDVGIGTSNPAVKFEVNGTTRINNVTVDPTAPNDGSVFFSLQPYIEGNMLPYGMSASTPTTATFNTSAVPFSKVWNSTAHTEFAADFIPVQPGETLYGELWVMRESGASGSGGFIYMGVARYDKDKKPIDGNLGLTYFVASGVNTTANGVWTKYSGTTTLPLTHASYDGSDGGPVRYVRPYFIVNYPTGTMATYWGGAIVRSIQEQRDNGTVMFNGNVGIGTNSPSAKLHVTGGAIYADNPSGAIRVLGTSGTPGNNDLGIWERSNPDIYALADWNTGTKGLFIDTANAYVGVGTIAPAAAFEIEADGSSGSPGAYPSVPRLYVESWAGDGPGVDGVALASIAAQRISYLDTNAANARVFQVGLDDRTPLIVRGNANTYLSDDLYVGHGASNDDDYIYIDQGTESIRWEEANTWFEFSDEIRTADPVQGSVFEDNDNVNYYVNPAGATSAILAGNVGIGMTAAPAKLTVAGSSNWNEATPGTTVGSVHLDPESTTDHFGGGITWGASDTGSGENAQAGIYVRSDGSYGTKMYFATTDNYGIGSKTRMYISEGGRVGIGTTSPANQLHVYGGHARLEYNSANNAQYGFINSVDGFHIMENAYYDGAWKSIEGSHQAAVLQTSLANNYAFAVSYDASVSAADEALTFSPSFVITTTGNTGVGTTAPNASVDILRASSSNVYDGLRVNRPDAQGQYAFVGYGQSSSDAYFGSVYTGGGANGYGSIHLRQYSSSMSARDVLNIDTIGNVGINTTGPTYSLDVNGNIRTQDKYILGVDPNSQTNTGEAWLFRASDREDGTMTVQLGGNDATGTSFEIVDRAWTKVIASISGEADAASFVVEADGDVTFGGGNVGIGVAPSTPLDIQTSGGVPVSIRNSGVGTTYMRFYSSGTTLRGTVGWSGSGFVIKNEDNSPVTIGTMNSASALVIADSGDATLAGDFRVNGNDIKDSSGTTRQTIGSDVIVTVG